MKVIISESKFKSVFSNWLEKRNIRPRIQIISESITEMERRGFEDEYVDEFERLKDKMVKLISKSLYSWGETEDNRIVIFNKDKKILLRYSPITKELYYDTTIGEKFTRLLPPLVWIRNGKFFIYEVFKKYFPELEVKHVMQAFIV